jgi:hypothetical protein
MCFSLVVTVAVQAAADAAGARFTIVASSRGDRCLLILLKLIALT